jgi:DNA-binding response OmpR family regulator
MNALSYENFLPVGAKNGEQAVRVVEIEKPDLVLLDLNMPGKGGWEVFQEITTAHPLLPVVVLTARTNQLFTSLGAGAGALIEKPFDFLKLLQTVRDLLSETAEERLARIRGQAASFHHVRPNGNDVTYARSCNAEGLAN